MIFKVLRVLAKVTFSFNFQVSFQFVETEINDLRFFIKDIKNELENHYKEPSADPTDLYQSKMTEFIRKIDPGFITLEKNHEIMTELFSQIVQSFGEDPKKIQSEEFFGTFKTFIVSFDVWNGLIFRLL